MSDDSVWANVPEMSPDFEHVGFTIFLKIFERAPEFDGTYPSQCFFMMQRDDEAFYVGCTNKDQECFLAEERVASLACPTGLTPLEALAMLGKSFLNPG